MSSGQRQLKVELEFLVDECLGRHDVPDALVRAGERVIRHDERFSSGTQDAVWLAEIANNPSWVVLTKDAQIRRRPLELEALGNARARVFTLTSASLTGAQQAAAFVRALPKIKRLCKRKGPFIATVTASGAVTVLKVKRRRKNGPKV